ncbi:MAG: hypothetical protein A2V46_02490 [Bacteroidetes bacterium RBG_19FT_COMBO_42_7]|nr:MAG: hypothetical protein A2V46_02490 [Bacteroidetes bacterium RBG_19FT_COMBO_42_7]
MKRKIILGISFIIMTLAFNSCEGFGTCKICRQVTSEIGGGVISEEPEAEYCDAALIAIEAKGDIIVGNTRISWECR